MELPKVHIRLRMSQADAHYGGNLVDGAKMLQLFGDVATELLIRYDGDEGLFRAYDNVEFLAPVFAGDYIEAYGEIIRSWKNNQERCEFEDIQGDSFKAGYKRQRGGGIGKPILVCKASGTCVVPLNKQRYKHDM